MGPTPERIRILRPILMLAKLLGMYPFGFEHHRISPRAFLIMIVFSLYISVHFVKLIPGLLANLNTLKDVLLLMMNSLVVLNNLAVILVFYFHREDVHKLWTNLDRAEMLLTINNMVMTSCKSAAKRKLQMVQTIAVSFVVYGSSFYVFGNPFIFSVLGVLRVGALRLLFMCLADEILDRLRRLNWQLKDYGRRFPPFLIPAADSEDPFREFECVAKNRHAYFSGFDRSSYRDVTFDRVRALNGIHKHTVDAIASLNNLFGPSLFLTLTATVFTNAISSCSTVIAFLYNDNGEMNYTYSFHLSRLAVNLYSQLTVIKKCDDIQSEGKKTGPLIHEILDEDYPEHIVKELELFSSLVYYRKTQIEAGGFFNVELKMIPSVIAILAPGMIFIYKSLKPVEQHS